MEQATTLQFRTAARNALRKAGISAGASWTNGAPKRGPMGRRRTETGTRTVGFRVWWHKSTVTPAKLVGMVEKELGKQGLTASTRFTDATAGHYRGGQYLRGTCDYPV